LTASALRRRGAISFLRIDEASVSYFKTWRYGRIWSSMASPAIFAVIGDALPKEKRAMGFTVQSFLKRIPMAVAPLIGGALIAGQGILNGVRTGLMITLALAALSVFVVLAVNIPVEVGAPASIGGVWRTFHSALKRLLISDIIIRTCEGLADIFVILYVTNRLGMSPAQYGLLVAVQMTTSMLVYLPAGKIADRTGRKPFVITTFVCFALFPFAIMVASSFSQLVIASIVGGLREIGEPSRKAMIVDFAAPHLRARTVGLYYLIRSLTVAPAAAIGGLLWQVSPATPFIIAGFVGLAGVWVFALTVEERYAG
jgi:MFS family permease